MNTEGLDRIFIGEVISILDTPKRHQFEAIVCMVVIGLVKRTEQLIATCSTLDLRQSLVQRCSLLWIRLITLVNDLLDVLVQIVFLSLILKASLVLARIVNQVLLIRLVEGLEKEV